MKGLPFCYKCPECGQKVWQISDTYPPTCNNKNVHSAKSVEMELQNVKKHKANN